MRTYISENYQYNYDRESDILYLSIGDPVPSYVEEISDNFLVRYSFETDEITGITIIDFSTLSNFDEIINLLPKINIRELPAC